MSTPNSAFSPPLAVSSPTLDEAELVAAAKANSPEAWSLIFDLHYRRILAYAEARVGDRDAAEELASTVFLQAVKSIRRYSYRGKPILAWLYGIAANVVKDHWRSAARHSRGPGGGLTARLRGVLGFGDDGTAIALPEPARMEPGLAPEVLDLRRAVEKLTPNQREVVVLYYLVGLTIPEVAATLGKNERAVYSLQTRALAALRKLLV